MMPATKSSPRENSMADRSTGSRHAFKSFRLNVLGRPDDIGSFEPRGDAAPRPARHDRRPPPNAAVPPSSAATRSSSTALVGFADAGIDVAERLQAEQRSGVVGIVEHE